MAAYYSRVLVVVFLAFGAYPLSAEIVYDDVSDVAGIGHAGETYGASWGDLDGDGYPDLFVSNHRTQPSLFLNTGNGAFIDVAKQTFTWINKPNADTHGGSWFDFNNDGHQDLFIGVGQGNPEQFLVNDGRGALINRTNELGVAYPAWGGRLPVWLDYNGDGLPDFILMQHASNPALMRQLPTGGFVQENASTNMVCRPGQYAQFLDVTGDGRLDVICPDNAMFPLRIYDTLPTPWTLMTDRMPQIAAVPDTIIGDFNNDGRMDVFALGGVELRPSGAELNSAGNKIEARLMGSTKGFDFVSGGKVTFALYQEGFGIGKVYIGAGGAHPAAVTFTLDPASPAVAGMPPDDPAVTPMMRIGYDPATQRWTVIQRSRTDTGESIWSETYFLISSTSAISDLKTTGMWLTDGASTPTLLMNRPEGFIDETAAAGLASAMRCVSVTAGDFDNDMNLDLYLACRTATSNIENILFRNQGNGTFTRITGAGGAPGPIGMSIGDGAGTADSVVTADYDVDGFLDLFLTNGLNMFPVKMGGPNKLYRNRGNNNRWIELDLVGTRSHREAVGARVVASAQGVTQTRIKNGSYHRWSHDHTRMHFGLAQAATVDLTVYWPSGTVDTYPAVPVNHLYRATESGGIQAVTPGPGQALPYPCGLPAVFNIGAEAPNSEAPNVDLGAGVFIAKNCASGAWQMRVVSGGSVPRLTYSGRIVSDLPFGAVTPRALEDGIDTLNATSDPREIVYEFNVKNNDWDGVDFLPQDGARTCFQVTPPAGVQVYMGPLQRPVSTQFELETIDLCEHQAPPPIDDDDGDDGNDNGGNDGTPPNDDGNGGGALGFPWLFALGAFLLWRKKRPAIMDSCAPESIG